MRRVLAVAVALVVAAVASANLLTNPGFEIGAGGGATPDGWWKYNEAGQESWAAMTGTNGMAFWSWNNDVYGGFGSDVYTNLVPGDVVSFSIWGLAENFSSYQSECWLQLEFWTNGASTYSVKITNSVYDAITADRNNWNQYFIGYTNYASDITVIKPIIGYGGATNAMGGNMSVKWDDADLVVSIPEPTIAAMLGFAGLLFAAIRRKARK